MNMHLPVNLECCMCAFTSEPFPAIEEEGILAVYTHVLCKSHMWALLKAEPRLRQPEQPVTSVSFVCVCGWLPAIRAQLRRCLNLQRGKQQAPPLAWDGDPQVSVPQEDPGSGAAGGGS